MTPADLLPPALAARIAVVTVCGREHWLLRAAPHRRGRRVVLGVRLGAHNSKRYPLIAVPGSRRQCQLLSHVVLTAAYGPPAPGQQERHNDAVCRVRECVAPGHIGWGLATENQRDATAIRMANWRARRAQAA